LQAYFKECDNIRQQDTLHKNKKEHLLFSFLLIAVIKKNQQPTIKEKRNVIPVIINAVTSVEGNKYAHHEGRSNA
jgi:hypothetical protein